MAITRYLSLFADFLNSSGVLGTSGGGTGLTSTPTSGQIDIGNGSGFTRTTLTAGTGISITNSAGGITIDNTSTNNGTVTSIATGIGLTGGPITTSGTVAIDTTYLAIGTYSAAEVTQSGSSLSGPLTLGNTYSNSVLGLPSGTWKVMGQTGYYYYAGGDVSYFYYLVLRLT